LAKYTLGLGGVRNASGAIFIGTEPKRSFEENLIGQIYEPARWIVLLDNSDPCWELFTYNSILNEPRYLSRALKCIKAAVGCGISKKDLNVSFNELDNSLRTVDGDVVKASDFLKATINMVMPVAVID